jgi:glycosyltransferase involved in cell wall biosynthesis
LRVLLINHEYTISGASLMMLRLARHLLARGHTCDVMAISGHHGALRHEYAALGIEHRITSEFADYDVAICNTICAATIVSSAAPFTRTIWWIHEGGNGLNIVRKQPSDWAGFRDATAIVFQTEHQRDGLYGTFLASRERDGVFVIPYGIDVPISGPSIPKTLPLRVVCTGTIDSRKRQGDLIRAVAALLRDDVECVIIGGLYSLDDTARRIAAGDVERFRLLKVSNEEALAWVRSADLFCLPSSAESQPLAILEAAMLGKPLVLTDLPSYSGIWRHGENCLLVPVGDIAAIAGALSALLASADLRHRLGTAARTTAGQFTEAAFLERFDAMLGVIVRASRRDPADRSSA